MRVYFQIMNRRVPSEYISRLFDAYVFDALGYFRPDLLVLTFVFGDQHGIILQIESQAVTSGHEVQPQFPR